MLIFLALSMLFSLEFKLARDIFFFPSYGFYFAYTLVGDYADADGV
jgi:hypothetical protein